MLQTLLTDRFRLSVHQEMKTMPVYALATGNSGPKLKDGSGDAECKVNVSVATGGQSYSFLNCTIGMVVDYLGNGIVDRPVVDNTGLTGKYDFRVVATLGFMSRDQPDIADLSPFAAIQDLGFRLERRTAPIEVIVIDRVAKPTEN